MLADCPIDGDKGKLGIGTDGFNCWDRNSNQTNDPEQDINGDNFWSVDDCVPQKQITQNPDVELNHQHFCEAFATLSQYPVGCPSAANSNPAGTLTEISAMLDDGTGQVAVSCDFAPNNRLLSLELKNEAYYWNLEGGFIANAIVITLEDELGSNSCFDLCQSDAECVASLAKSRQLPSANIVYDCSIFHHSDTVQPYEVL
jgi:hypothetical protein